MNTFEDFIKTGFLQENDSIYVDSFISVKKNDFINENITLDVSVYSYIETKLILKNAEFHGTYEEGFAFFEDAFIEKDSVGYTLKCSLNDNYIIFKDLECTSKPLKVPFEFYGNETPWAALMRFAHCIHEKIQLFHTALSEKENALEPLLKDFFELKFEILKAKFPDDKKLSKLIAKMSENNYTAYEIFGDNELNQYLSKPKFESLWREIFDLLVDSQNEYEDNNALGDSADLNRFRSHIHSVMLENGYTGKYPNYKKTAKAKGVHLVSKNGKTVLVRGKTITVFAEFNETEYMNFGTFKLCFYTTLQNPENITDKFSCLFSEKSFVKTAYLNYEVDENGHVHFEHGYLNFPEILCKAAEFKHLTVSERKALRFNKNELPVPITIFISAICGLFFGIIMILGLILLEFLITLLFGKTSYFPELFMDTPWHFVFLFCFLSVTVLMSLFVIISEKLGF